MARQTIPVSLPAGVIKRKGKLEASGRYVDADHMRFTSGAPEKIGGWTKYTTAAFAGIARAVHAWNDLASRTVTAIGTTQKLYAVDAGLGLVDITPQGSTATLTAAFSTQAGSQVVTVTAPGHAAKIGQGITLSGGATVGGLLMDGSWLITGETSSTYSFTHTSAATSTAGPAGNATVAYDIPPGAADPAAGFGYGVGRYGIGTYGTPRANSNIFFEPYQWSLSHFGRMLLASPMGGPLYVWDPSAIPAPRATPVPNAPGAMRGHFITPERFVIALGASPDSSPNLDPMLMRWCSQADYTIWDADTTNTANSRRLTEGKKIMGGGALGQGVSLIWTDTAVYLHQYTGSTYVFDTRLVGTAAGLAGPNAFCMVQGRAFWWGGGHFRMYGGSIQTVPKETDVLQWVQEQLRSHYETKTLCFYNQAFNEVWWLFVPNDASEPTFYVTFNITEGVWTPGTLTRTAAAQAADSTSPLLAGTDGWLYLHESGTDADGAPLEAFIQSGPSQINQGGSLMNVTGFIPDFGEIVGDVQLLIQARDRPNGNIIDQNSTSISDYDGMVDLRMRGRVIDFRLSQSLLGGKFSVGAPAVEIAAGGTKR